MLFVNCRDPKPPAVSPYFVFYTKTDYVEPKTLPMYTYSLPGSWADSTTQSTNNATLGTLLTFSSLKSRAPCMWHCVTAQTSPSRSSRSSPASSSSSASFSSSPTLFSPAASSADPSRPTGNLPGSAGGQHSSASASAGRQRRSVSPCLKRPMKRGRGCRRADAQMRSLKGHKSKLKGECLNQVKRRAVYWKRAQITFYLQLRLGKMCLRRKGYKKLNLRRGINE